MVWKNRIVEQAQIPVKDLHSNPGNWRKHPRAQRQALEGVVDAVGVVQSVVFNRRTGRLVDGHLRVDMAAKAGEAELPVTIVDLSEDEERLVLATMDPIGAMAGIDDDALRGLLDELGMDHDRAVAAVLDDLSRRVPKEKAAEGDSDKKTPLDEVAEKWNVQAGDLWVIPSLATAGKSHRILCGDSTSEDDVSRLMGDERAELFATDPPYQVAYDGTRGQGMGVRAGKDWSDAYREGSNLFDILAFMDVATKHGIKAAAPWYCWHDFRHGPALFKAWTERGILPHQMIVWVKPSATFSRGIFKERHELCMFGWLKGNDPRGTTGAPNLFGGQHKTTVWDMPRPSANDGIAHPTRKPVELFEIPMQMHTLQGELCYEPFSGSGTQLVAAERMGRICYAMELMPHFVAVALERLAEMGLTPERTTNG